jgi:molybdate transport repressor ModE-like protein
VRRLKILHEVALRGTIAAAADALGFTPSALSQQLSALERQTGTGLLERGGRRARLTREGQILVQQTERILSALEEAQAALEHARGTVNGELRLAASGSIARALVIPTIAELGPSYPQLRIAVLEYDALDSLRELRSGDIDLVLGHDYEDDPQPAARDVVRVDLFTEELFLIAPVGRLKTPIRLGNLARETWAAEPAGTACGLAFRRACRTAGFEPDVRYTSSESATLLSAVVNGHVVAILPRLACTELPPGIGVFPLASAPMRRVVFAAHRCGTPVRPSVQVVLDALTAAARGITSWLGYSSRPGTTDSNTVPTQSTAKRTAGSVRR